MALTKKNVQKKKSLIKKTSIKKKSPIKKTSIKKKSQVKKTKKKQAGGQLKKYKYAVVHWLDSNDYFNAGFIKGFDNLEEAKKEAYRLAEEKSDNETTRKSHRRRGHFLKKKEMQLNNINVSPYHDKTIVEYGAEFGDTIYYFSIVPWFHGVTNNWDSESDNTPEINQEEWKKISKILKKKLPNELISEIEKHLKEWYPKYGNEDSSRRSSIDCTCSNNRYTMCEACQLRHADD
jgi:hypothetical protein